MTTQSEVATADKSDSALDFMVDAAPKIFWLSTGTWAPRREYSDRLFYDRRYFVLLSHATRPISFAYLSILEKAELMSRLLKPMM